MLIAPTNNLIVSVRPKYIRHISGIMKIAAITDESKINPNTPITREIIPTIQKEFSKYRDWSLEEVKAGRSALSEGVTPENYMRALSIVDGIPGQRTTSFKFPLSYMQTFNNGKLVSNENKGFATVKPSK